MLFADVLSSSNLYLIAANFAFWKPSIALQCNYLTSYLLSYFAIWTMHVTDRYEPHVGYKCQENWHVVYLYKMYIGNLHIYSKLHSRRCVS